MFPHEIRLSMQMWPSILSQPIEKEIAMAKLGSLSEHIYKYDICMAVCGRHTSTFKGLSFHIGAATAAALHGKSIGSSGWASDAFRKYIRMS